MSDRYDTGILNDYGGGNAEWWQDYIRAEIERANDFHADIHERNEATIAALKAENERLRAELDIRVGDLVMLRRAIQENDQKIELFFRIDDALRETRAALTRQEG